jgi:hypothetical protein
VQVLHSATTDIITVTILSLLVVFRLYALGDTYMFAVMQNRNKTANGALGDVAHRVH